MYRLSETILDLYQLLRVENLLKFAKIGKPLTNLSKRDVTWRWDKKQVSAFKKLKKALTTAPVLHQADHNLPYKLRTDASAYAVRGVLLQGKKYNKYPIEYASRLLISTKRNYSTTERKALALVWLNHKFRSYFEEALSLAITDQQSFR